MAIALCAAMLLAHANPQSEITSLLTEFLGKVDDVAMHERFWADDLVYVSAAGVVKTKAMILESMRAGDTPGTRNDEKSTFSAEEVKIRSLAPDIAVLNFRLVQHVGDKANHFRNTGTFVRRKGKWQVINWQATRETEH